MIKNKAHEEIILHKMKAFSPSSEVLAIMERLDVVIHSKTFKQYLVITDKPITYPHNEIVVVSVINDLYAEARVIGRTE